MSCGNLLFPVQAYDWQKRWLRWGARSYESHIERRPYVAELHDELAATVADPDIVGELSGGGWDYYRAGLLRGSFSKCYLMVYVEWNSAVGEIRTAFALRNLRTDHVRYHVLKKR